MRLAHLALFVGIGAVGSFANIGSLYAEDASPYMIQMPSSNDPNRTSSRSVAQPTHQLYVPTPGAVIAAPPGGGCNPVAENCGSKK